MMGMKKMTGKSRYISMPVFSIIFVAVLLLDAAFYNSIRTNVETNYRETENARITWIQRPWNGMSPLPVSWKEG